MSDTSTPTIIKAAGIVLNDQGHLLVVRRKESDIWISLGGKPDGDETLVEALRRELMEESGLEVVGEPKLYHQSPVEPAAGKPGLTVQISSFLVDVQGEPKVNPEDKVEEFHWLTKAEFEAKAFNLGSVLEQFVVPKLIEDGLLK